MARRAIPASRFPSPRRRPRLPPDDETGLKGAAQPPLPLLQDETVIERVRAAEQSTLTARYTAKALEFLRENRDRPFFLYLAHTAVHWPHYPGQEFRGKSKNGLLGDWIEEMDWSVGQVLDTVRALGLGEKTLVIFTSDNGGPLNQGANNHPLRGGKTQTFEGGLRVCTIAWWPGKIPAGTSTGEITAMMDILPTFVKLAGGKLPDDRTIDGRDIGPLLVGAPDARSPHDVFYYYRGLALEAVRSGPWKLHLQRGLLFNLDSDVGESTDVAAANRDDSGSPSHPRRTHAWRPGPGWHRPWLPPAWPCAAPATAHRSGRHDPPGLRAQVVRSPPSTVDLRGREQFAHVLPRDLDHPLQHQGAVTLRGS